MKKIVLGIFFALSLFYFNNVQAADVRLATGSVVEQEKIDALLKCKTFADIRNLISQDETVKLYFINMRVGTRTAVQISEEDMTDDKEVIGYYMQSDQEVHQLGLYVSNRFPNWPKNHSAIIVPVDTSFDILAHEYLHHLISSNKKNGFYSHFDGHKVNLSELEKVAYRLSGELKSLQNKMQSGVSDLSKEEQIRWYETNIEYYINTLLRTITYNLEEMEIEQFLFDNREKFCLEPARIYFFISSVMNCSRDIWSFAYDEDLQDLIIEMKRQLDKLYDEEEKKQKLMKKFELVVKTLDDLLPIANPLVEGMEAFMDENEEQYTLYHPDVYRVGDVNFDGSINEKDKEFLSSLLEDPTKMVSYPTELRCDLDRDMKITSNDLNWLNNILSIQDLKFGGVKAKLLERAHELGYEVDLGEWSGDETDEAVMPGLYSPYTSLYLVLADDRARGKNIKKIVFDAQDFSYDAETKIVHLQRNWGEAVVIMADYFFNLP